MNIKPLNKRYTSAAIKSKAVRFLNKELQTKKLVKLYNNLTPGEQLKLLGTLMEYSLAKPSPDTITNEQIDNLWNEMKKHAQNQKTV